MSHLATVKWFVLWMWKGKNGCKNLIQLRPSTNSSNGCGIFFIFLAGMAVKFDLQSPLRIMCML